MQYTHPLHNYLYTYMHIDKHKMKNSTHLSNRWSDGLLKVPCVSALCSVEIPDYRRRHQYLFSKMDKKREIPLRGQTITQSPSNVLCQVLSHYSPENPSGRHSVFVHVLCCGISVCIQDLSSPVTIITFVLFPHYSNPV